MLTAPLQNQYQMYMNEARKLHDHQPGFMAIENEKKDINIHHSGKQKKYWFDTTVLITWIVFIAIAILFWILFVKLL